MKRHGPLTTVSFCLGIVLATLLALLGGQSAAQGCLDECAVTLEQCDELIAAICHPDATVCLEDGRSDCTATHETCLSVCDGATASLASGALATVTPPPTFFTEAHYAGTAVSLPVGTYTRAALVAHSIANNTISSLRVAPGFKVQAYANGDFTGPSSIVSGDTPALAARGFDNQLSSVRISRIAVAATFYEFAAHVSP